MFLKIFHLLRLNKKATCGNSTICSSTIICSMNENSILLTLRIPIFISIPINRIYWTTIFQHIMFGNHPRTITVDQGTVL